MTAFTWTALITLLTIMAWVATIYVLLRGFVAFVDWLLGLDDGQGPENQF